MLLVALVLSQQAQSAEADPTKTPLTANEKAQCRVQLTEFNERVRSNNAAVDAVKALEANIVSPSPSPKTSSPDAACNSADGARGVERQIEGTFAAMRADEKKHQDEVDRVANAQAKAQSWTADKRGKIWLQILRSPRFMAFQQQTQPYMDELMRIFGSKPKNKQEECHLVQRIAAMLPAIKSVNAKQYGFMADEIRSAK